MVAPGIVARAIGGHLSRPTLAPPWDTACAWTGHHRSVSRRALPHRGTRLRPWPRRAANAAPLAASRRRSRRCGVRVGCAPVRPRARAAAHPARRVGLVSHTARSQSLILSDCTGGRARRPGRERAWRGAHPWLRLCSRLHKNLLHSSDAIPGRPESPPEDTGGAAADSPCAPTPPASHRTP